MNHPNPHDQPEEPECDACQGTGGIKHDEYDAHGEAFLVIERCVLCTGTGTLSQAAQRELGEGEAEQRKIDERRGK